MIQSIFLISSTGEIIIERHFRGITPRYLCEQFWERATISLNHHGGISTMSSAISSNPIPLYDTVSPVIEIKTRKNEIRPFIPFDKKHTIKKCEQTYESFYVFSTLRDGISYLGVCLEEISPLFVLEFLNRLADIFTDYFGSPTDETNIKDNFSIVYQIMEEMMDFGWPLTTEPNALKAMIRPPSVIRKLHSVVTGGSNAIVTDALPKCAISNIPWRTAGVRHSNNEIYIDIFEEIDATVDIHGNSLSSDVSGFIHAQCNLSGVPDLLLTFENPEIIDDCSFHPCVRYSRFETDKVISFIPPDGHFELMKYRVSSSILENGFISPIICVPSLTYVQVDDSLNSYTGNIMLNVRTQSMNSLIHSSLRKGSLKIEDVSVTIPFPKTIKTAYLNANMGQVLYDEDMKVAKWIIGKLEEKDKPVLNGTFLINGNRKPKLSHPLIVSWKVPLASISGISVNGLTLTKESYKPFKGVRNIVKSGKFQVLLHQ